MDLDYFIHEKDMDKIRKFLLSNNDQPAIAFPQYQFFTYDRYHVKTKLCIQATSNPKKRSSAGNPTLRGGREEKKRSKQIK